MTPLRTIIDALEQRGLLLQATGEATEIAGITDDSRVVEQGDLFCAWQGVSVDAHTFIPQAERAGAAAVLVEREVEARVPRLIANDGRRAASVAGGSPPAIASSSTARRSRS